MKERVRLKFKSYDPRLLDEAVKRIVSTVKRIGAGSNFSGPLIIGPVPLPNTDRCFTVLRSPHVNKKSREQFELKTHKRLLEITSPSKEIMEALMQLNISSGVDVEIK